MIVASNFYVRKVARFDESIGGTAFEVTLHACGEHIADPCSEMTEALGSVAVLEGFRAAGVMILRVTNPKLAEAFHFGSMYKVSLEEQVGAVYQPGVGVSARTAAASAPSASQTSKKTILGGVPA